jgi:hypothetical protein
MVLASKTVVWLFLGTCFQALGGGVSRLSSTQGESEAGAGPV